MEYIDIIQWENEVLYPALYPHIDEALNCYGHDFKQSGGKWRTRTHLDGRQDGGGKYTTEVTAQKPGIIHDWADGWMNIVNYVAKMDHTDRRKARTKLAKLANVAEPVSEGYRMNMAREAILERTAELYVDGLANDPAAEATRQYLYNRYGEQEVKAMGLGYMPGFDKLKAHLVAGCEAGGYTVHDVEGYMNTYKSKDRDGKLVPMKALGTTHTVVIPSERYGRIDSFIYRYTGTPGPDDRKFLYNTGSRKLSNITQAAAGGSVVVVESYVDARLAAAKGMDNVVASGMRELSADNIKELARLGVRSVYLVPDLDKGTDKAGRDKQDITREAMQRSVDKLLAAGIGTVFVAELPDLNPADADGKTDPGDVLAQAGGEQMLAQAVHDSLAYWDYELQGIIDRYGRMQADDGTLAADEQLGLVDDLVAMAGKIRNGVHRDMYIKRVTDLEALQQLGVTREALQARIEEQRMTVDRMRQQAACDSIMAKAAGMAKADPAKALEYMMEATRKAQAEAGSSKYERYLQRTTEAEVKERERQRPDDVPSGFTIGISEYDHKPEKWMLPAGALTIVAGATGHGKTRMLANLAVNTLDTLDGKEVYFITYEEEADMILYNCLNVWMNMPLNNGANSMAIHDYFKTGGAQWPVRHDTLEKFEGLKARFFSEYIDTGRLNIQYSSDSGRDLANAIRYIKEHGNPGLILVDYIQFIPGGQDVRNSRQEELKVICQLLCDAAQTTGLPIVLGAQFNRQVQNRNDVVLTNLGEAGDIERIANTVVGIWNGDHQERNTDKEKQISTKTVGPMQMWLKILKRRRGSKNVEEVLDMDNNTGKLSNRKETTESDGLVRKTI